MMTSTEQATVFVAPSGKAFAFMREHPYADGDVAFSPDGKTFYALDAKGVGSSTEGGKLVELDFSFEDPHHGYSGELHYDGESIEFNGTRFAKQDQQVEVTVVPLPATRRVEYLCQADDGTIVYVSADEYNYSYASFRLFVGDGATMREVPVEDVARYRDGGTTYISTSEGIFFSPSPFNAQRKPKPVPSWGKKGLVILTKDDYKILEEGDTVIISKR